MGLLTNGLSINCFYTKKIVSCFLPGLFMQIYGSKLKGFMSYFQQVTLYVWY
jgi:hypothetical protein